MSNYLIKCCRYCAVYCWHSACSASCTAAACCSTMHGAAPDAAHCVMDHIFPSDEYLCTCGAYRRHIVE